MTGLVGVLRIPQWLHFAALPLAGLDRKALVSPSHLARCAIAVAAASCSLGYAYAINAMADRASDISVEKNPLAGISEVPLPVKAVVATAAVGALGLGLLGGPRMTLLVISSLAASTVYSVGPRIKAWPVLGAVCNTAIFAPLLGFAMSKRRPPPPALATLCTAFVGLILQNQLLHEVADAHEDATADARTTARLLGPRLARGVAGGLAVPAAGIAIALAPEPTLGFAAAGVLACGAFAAVAKRPAAAARRLHRRIAVAGGALLFAIGLLT